MNIEEELYYYLRVVATHFIKHCIALPEPVARITKTMEQDQWKQLSPSEKREHLQPLAEMMKDPDSELNRHFNEYPHHWSRNKYADFKNFIAEYAKSVN